MFTGLVLEIGIIARVIRGGGKAEIEVSAPLLSPRFSVGDSVAINGVCQTVTRCSERSFSVEALAETMKKTTLGKLTQGARVNLEPAVAAATPLGGHFVQGHVSGTGTVTSVRRDRENVYFTVTVPADLMPYCVAEGSIAIDGVSLTIARLAGRAVTINVIPHTWEATVLADRAVGDSVNLETDIIARYVERFLAVRAEHSGVRSEQLTAWGYQ